MPTHIFGPRSGHLIKPQAITGPINFGVTRARLLALDSDIILNNVNVATRWYGIVPSTLYVSDRTLTTYGVEHEKSTGNPTYRGFYPNGTWHSYYSYADYLSLWPSTLAVPTDGNTPGYPLGGEYSSFYNANASIKTYMQIRPKYGKPSFIKFKYWINLEVTEYWHDQFTQASVAEANLPTTIGGKAYVNNVTNDNPITNAGVELISLSPLEYRVWVYVAGWYPDTPYLSALLSSVEAVYL